MCACVRVRERGGEKEGAREAEREGCGELVSEGGRGRGGRGAKREGGGEVRGRETSERVKARAREHERERS